MAKPFLMESPSCALNEIANGAKLKMQVYPRSLELGATYIPGAYLCNLRPSMQLKMNWSKGTRQGRLTRDLFIFGSPNVLAPISSPQPPGLPSGAHYSPGCEQLKSLGIPKGHHITFLSMKFSLGGPKMRFWNNFSGFNIHPFCLGHFFV